MITEFARDHAFTIAWLGLMAMVWFGWGQEDPAPAWRWRLAAGSVLGVMLAGVFGYATILRWAQGSALEDRYAWFGVLVAVEVVAAGAGCLWLALHGRGRWMAWWVAMVVAAHFAPLALLLQDLSLGVLALVQLAGLTAIVPRLRGADVTSSRLVGPLMGIGLLVFALISAVIFLVRVGAPW